MKIASIITQMKPLFIEILVSIPVLLLLCPTLHVSEFASSQAVFF